MICQHSQQRRYQQGTYVERINNDLRLVPVVLVEGWHGALRYPGFIAKEWHSLCRCCAMGLRSKLLQQQAELLKPTPCLV